MTIKFNGKSGGASEIAMIRRISRVLLRELCLNKDLPEKGKQCKESKLRFSIAGEKKHLLLSGKV